MRVRLLSLVLITGLRIVLFASAPRLEAQQSAPTVAADSVEVIRVVQRYIDALTAKDTAYLRAASSPAATTVMVSAQPATAGRLSVQTVDEVVAAIGRGTRRFTGRVWSIEVSLAGSVAIYRAPYDAWYDGVFSHCGTDHYVLARIEGAWRVSQLVYTRQADGCTPSPLGPPR